MNAVRMLARSQLRREWKSIVVLVLLVRVIGAVVLASIAWQATTLAVVGLVFGIPLGLFVGRSVWRVVADGLGVSTTATIPVLTVLVLVPAAILLANFLAALSGRSAARTRPAVVLRSE
jgi:hypothetical protein